MYAVTAAYAQSTLNSTPTHSNLSGAALERVYAYNFAWAAWFPFCVARYPEKKTKKKKRFNF